MVVVVVVVVVDVVVVQHALHISQSSQHLCLWKISSNRGQCSKTPDMNEEKLGIEFYKKRRKESRAYN